MSNNPLTKDSMMVCERHGRKRPTFMCIHLRNGGGVGFIEPTDPPAPEWPFRNAWCEECDRVFLEQGEWNDVSEGFAQVVAVCEGCFFDIKARIKSEKSNAHWLKRLLGFGGDT